MPPLKSWLRIPPHSDFSILNIPFGIITSRHSQVTRRPAIRIGDHVLDLLAFSRSAGFQKLPSFKEHLSVFEEPTLNAFAALGQPVHREVRRYIQEVFKEDTPYPELLKDNEEVQKECLLKEGEWKNHLPMRIGDYTDFFAGINHARNAGTMFRGAENALQPNYTHVPIGYHGRASSVVVSGTQVTRPNGQIILDPKAPGPKKPVFGPSRRLDIELELGCFLCTGNELGEPIKVNKAGENIFGYVLMNDWSARDIQNWEYVPLGPFNGKNFSTTISPWVVLQDAIAPFRTAKLETEASKSGELLDYLKEERDNTGLDINLEIDLTTPDGSTTTIGKVNAKNLIWSFEQMLAHHSSGGCNMRTGDLLGSGTITGEGEQEMGSLLEMTWGGSKDIWLVGMETRKFLKDGDEITLRGTCGEEEGGRVGFGECRGKVISAVVY
ncbi:fumarylacetoacetase [Botrytis cinerea]